MTLAWACPFGERAFDALEGKRRGIIDSRESFPRAWHRTRPCPTTMAEGARGPQRRDGHMREEATIARRNIIRLFESRKGQLDYRVRRDYVRNGIVTIPCRVSDYHDVISGYSARGFETLNKEFVDYVRETAELTPTECPIVLSIIGDCLTPTEQRIIAEIVRDDFSYDLGIVERDARRHTRVFVLMLVGLLASGLALWLTEAGDDLPRELLYILFWFAGETLCDYLFLTGYDLRRERRLAGRLASIKVTFSESYEDPAYSEDDVERLYSEIERDVNETFREGR